MKVFIPNTQEDRLRQILNRVGLSFEPEVELLKCMLLRQFLLFAMQPKSYVVAIYKKYRVRKDVDQLNIKNVETKLITDLIAELDKVLSGKLAEAPSARLDEAFVRAEGRDIHIKRCHFVRLFNGQGPPCRLHDGP